MSTQQQAQHNKCENKSRNSRLLPQKPTALVHGSQHCPHVHWHGVFCIHMKALSTALTLHTPMCCRCCKLCNTVEQPFL